MNKFRARVAIAGGGIGGLVMALQLQRRGIECIVFEAAEKLEPLGSNGASQAILETESLASALAEEADVERALARYEAERREATGKIVLANRGNGPDQVMQLAEERAPDGFEHVNDVIPQEELEAISARYKQTAEFAKTQVNAR